MKNIKVSLNNGICSCNGCYAKNYKYENEEQVKIYDVQMGEIVIHMCEDCMDQLIGTMMRARAEEGGKL